MRTFEIIKIRGRRIVGSFLVRAKDMTVAHRNAKARLLKDGINRCRIREVTKGKARREAINPRMHYNMKFVF